MDLGENKSNVIDFEQYKERRHAKVNFAFNELSSPEREFQGKLRLSKEDAEMVIYCMRLGREYFRMEVENNSSEDNQPLKDLDMVNSLLDMIQYETLKIQAEKCYILNLSFFELALIVNCVEMTRNAVNKGIDVFQWETGDKEVYIKWLEGTFFHLLDVYEKWRFYQGK